MLFTLHNNGSYDVLTVHIDLCEGIKLDKLINTQRQSNRLLIQTTGKLRNLLAGWRFYKALRNLPRHYTEIGMVEDSGMAFNVHSTDVNKIGRPFSRRAIVDTYVNSEGSGNV